MVQEEIKISIRELGFFVDSLCDFLKNFEIS